MRKAILMAMLTALLTISVNTDAQVLKMGVKGGMNSTHMHFSNGNLDYENRSGFFFGPTLKIAIPLFSLGADISALYDQREFISGEEGDVMKIKLKQIAVPINLRLTFGSSKSLAVFFYGGPQFGFNINDEKNLEDHLNTWKYEDSNFSVNLGGGLLILNALQLFINYNIDCGKSGEMTVNDAYQTARKHESKANAWQVGAAIYF